MELDPQHIGIIGKHIVIANLFAAGLEVAEPIRDRGVDLIAFHDGKNGERFDAWPIQVKSSRGKSFLLDKKYEKLPRLIIVYVWNADCHDKNEIFALTYPEALKVLEEQGYANKKSWTQGRKWVVTNVGVKLEMLLEPHRMTPERWAKKLHAAR